MKGAQDRDQCDEPLLGLATTRELLNELAVRMEVTQNSNKGRDLGGLCREALANLDGHILDYRTAGRSVDADEQVVELPEQVERVELSRIAGKMLGSLDYLRAVAKVRAAEGSDHQLLAWTLADLVWARERIIALSEALPEGPLEAFAREHPLVDDPIDGPYCGYKDADGKAWTCPVRDPALHWDAWEMMGTRHTRPRSAHAQ